MSNRTVVQHILRGCGHLRFCGYHPGTVFLVLLAAAGFATGGYGGAAIMLAVLLPLYIHGAYMRSKLDDQIEREMNDLP